MTFSRASTPECNNGQTHQLDQSTKTHNYSPTALRIVALCFVLSGATGLIYEVLWARMLGLVFGATTLAVSTVLAAFMGGLAIGSAIAGRIAARIKWPIRAYGFVEIGIAAYALVVPVLFAAVDDLYSLLWTQFSPGFFVVSVIRFLLSSLMLLVPTTLMGATLPLLSSALVRAKSVTSSSITKLYMRNLLGAILGCLIAGFVLLPKFGVRNTIYVASFVNVVIGLAAILIGRRSTDSVRTKVSEITQAIEEVAPSSTWFWLFCAFVSGFVTFSTQVAWTRLLTMIVGSSTYAFSIAVALFLAGLAGGAFIVGRSSLHGKLLKAVFILELFTALALVFSLFAVNRIPGLLLLLGLRLSINSWAGMLALQVLSVGLLILIPALLMGTVMPLVLEWAEEQKAATAQWVGRSYAVNTVGAIAGAFGAGFLLIPKLSTRFTVLFAAALCILVAAFGYAKRLGGTERGRGNNFTVATASFVLIALIFVVAPQIEVANLSLGAYDSLVRVVAKTRITTSLAAAQQTAGDHELLMFEEGPTSTVSVRKDWGVTSLAINGRTNASDRDDMPTQVMLGQLPLLIAPGNMNSLVVGFASGVTVGAMLQSPIQSIECVELEPSTVVASRYFEHVNNRPLIDPRVRMIIDDARAYLRVTPSRYDMIVSEPSHPWVPGVANLFTQEFFTLGRDRLAEDGVFVQWVQIYQISTDSLKSVLRTFQSVFPHVWVFRVEGAAAGKDLILIGSRRPLSFDRIASRITDARIAAELKRVQIYSEDQIRSWFVCDESRLGPAVAGAVINTDDNMYVETTVPREAFRPWMEKNSEWVRALGAK